MTDAIHRLKAEVIKNFGTPCLVIDLDVVERNIQRAQNLCDAAGLANRPHIKTHKSPLWQRCRSRLARVGLPAKSSVRPK